MIGTGLFKVTLCSIIGDGSARANDTPKTPFRVSSDRAARERTSIHSQPSLAKENGGYVPFRRREFWLPRVYVLQIDCLITVPGIRPALASLRRFSMRARHDDCERLLCCGVALGTETFLAELCPRGDGPERRVEVVRDGVREVLQLRLGATISQ